MTEWRFAPGDATGFHTHAHDYVVVPLTTGRLKMVEAGGGEVMAELTAGSPFFRDAGVAHDVINHNAHEFVFIEVEHKQSCQPPRRIRRWSGPKPTRHRQETR